MSQGHIDEFIDFGDFGVSVRYEVGMRYVRKHKDGSKEDQSHRVKTEAN
jgi:hypothetical protein